ncbi:MAG: RagB/SusD family nutrient uptake outer membrane protein [Bacteroidales bacterium]|nr:RagB/SusD family nutrient uptake outer membrane protein [Bacteroidales bacterium]
MKKIHISFCMAVMMLAATSCDFLTTENIGKSTTKTFFSDITSLEPAMNGVYHYTNSFYNAYFIPYSEIAADEWILSTANAGIWMDYQDYISTSDYETSAVGYIWKNGYSIINNTNEIIHYAPKLKDQYPGHADLIDNVTASAYFIRALIHHDLCLAYGQNYTFTPDASHPGIAIRNTVPGLNDIVKRSPVKDVYSQIISDLKTAERLFSNCSNTAEYATPLACKALLARIYLYMNDWENAAAYASEVIEEKPLASRDNYARMFCEPKYLDGEIIFRLNGFGQSSNLYSMAYFESPKIRPAEKIRSLLSGQDDIRSSMFSMSAGGKVYDGLVLKYCVTADVASDEERYISPIVLRNSEMYLIRAEARCNLGKLAEAADDIKVLEARACGTVKEDIALDYSGKDELYAIINEERQKELCFEGMRLFDITRRHEDLVRDASSTSSVKTIAYPDPRFVLQIPYIEIDVNGDMVQNPL